MDGMKSTAEIWKRGIMQMVVAALAITLVVVIVIRINDRGDDDGGAAPQPSVAPLPKVGKPYANKELGVQLRLPMGWTTKQSGGTIELRSDDDKAAVSIATSPRAGDDTSTLDPAIAGLMKRYPGAEVTQKINGEMTGGLVSKGAVLEAKTDDGKRIRIVVSVATGEKLRYLVEVSSTALASNSVAEAQTVLRYLRLTG